MSLTLNAFTLVRNERTGGTSFTNSLTVAGNFLVVAIGGATGTAPTNITATYGGVPMVQRAIRLQGASRGAVAIFTLEAPPSGTNNLVFAIETGTLTSAAIGAWDFSGSAVVIGGAVTANGDNPAVITREVATPNTVLIAATSHRSGNADTLSLSPAQWVVRHYANTQGANSQDSANLFTDNVVAAGSRSITASYAFVGQVVAAGLIEIAPVIPPAEVSAAGMLPLSGSASGAGIATGSASGILPLGGAASALAIASGTGAGLLPIGGSASAQVMALANASGVLPLSGFSAAQIVMPIEPRFAFVVDAAHRTFVVPPALRRFIVDAPDQRRPT